MGRRRHVRGARAPREGQTKTATCAAATVTIDAQGQHRRQRREGPDRALRRQRSHRRRTDDVVVVMPRKKAEKMKDIVAQARAGGPRRRPLTGRQAPAGLIPLPPTGSVLAIDYGDARHGVAVSDPTRTFVFGRDTLERSSETADFAALDRSCAARTAIVLVVVGFPLNADGSEGGAAKSARAFAAKVAAHLNLPVALVDERYTTIEADEALRLQPSRLARAPQEDRQGRRDADPADVPGSRPASRVMGCCGLRPRTAGFSRLDIDGCRRCRCERCTIVLRSRLPSRSTPGRLKPAVRGRPDR